MVLAVSFRFALLLCFSCYRYCAATLEDCIWNEDFEGFERALNEEGLDLSVTNEENESQGNALGPLNIAAFKGIPAMVTVLLDRGVHPNVRHGENETPLLSALNFDSTASLQNKEEVVRILVERGADVMACEPDTRNYPIILSGWVNSPHIALLLLKHGANVNAVNICGTTALMAAAANGYHHVVETLLRWGADVNAAEEDGYTAISIPFHPIVGRNPTRKVLSTLVDYGSPILPKKRIDRFLSFFPGAWNVHVDFNFRKYLKTASRAYLTTIGKKDVEPTIEREMKRLWKARMFALYEFLAAAYAKRYRNDSQVSEWRESVNEDLNYYTEVAAESIFHDSIFTGISGFLHDAVRSSPITHRSVRRVAFYALLAQQNLGIDREAVAAALNWTLVNDVYLSN